MRLPRDLSGHDLIRLLRRFGYEATRQIGSHIRLESNYRGRTHHLTVPNHSKPAVGNVERNPF